ncbi:SipW-dependent-type signal peptide-containing protein [Natrialba swarupiae]|uniref:SipW-dependent-type signal peptide-containing protein n=1 Tax=Natrialba swarupiae TaxID=2448032 RepID=UPI00192E5715|nr:SipW-dependent-type signal peptide-containing protein [Natrialba swarupiae]
MTDNNEPFGLSRRKILGGMGAIGVASVGAGLGTTAYFSDQEEFTGNTLTAGTLAIKVDWQQRYWGAPPEVRPQDYATTANEAGETVSNYPHVNAFPDDSGDGEQDLGGVVYAGENAVFSPAEIPACCDCVDGEYYVTYGGDSHCIEPIVDERTAEEFYDDSRDDVSSLFLDIQRENGAVLFLYRQDLGGSELGEPRLFFVLDKFGNDDGGGYATFTVEGDLTDVVWEDLEWEIEDDPGADSADEYSISSTEATASWIWGDNRTDGGVLGSLTEDFALRINPDLNGAAALSGGTSTFDPTVDVGLTSLVVLSGDPETEIVLEDDLGGPMADDDLGDIVIHSECGLEMGEETAAFGPNAESLIELDDVKPGDSGEVTFSLHVCDNPAYIWMGATGFDAESVLGEFVRARARLVPGCLNEVDGFDAIDGYDGDVVVEGTLNEVLAALADAAYQGVALTTEDGDACFDPIADSTCVAFEWWFPIGQENVNDAQGESVSFDVGFYAEQCRHNDQNVA